MLILTDQRKGLLKIGNIDAFFITLKTFLVLEILNFVVCSTSFASLLGGEVDGT